MLGHTGIHASGGILVLTESNTLINNTLLSGSLKLGVLEGDSLTWNVANAINLLERTSWQKWEKGTLVLNSPIATTTNGGYMGIIEGQVTLNSTGAVTLAATTSLYIAKDATGLISSGANNINVNSLITGEGLLKLSSTGTISLNALANSQGSLSFDIMGGTLAMGNGNLVGSTINLFANTAHTINYDSWKFKFTTNKVAAGQEARMNMAGKHRTVMHDFDLGANTTLKFYCAEGVYSPTFAGVFSGAGNLLLTGTANGTWGGGNYTDYTFTRASNAFTGTISIASDVDAGAKAHNHIVLQHENALSNASFIKFVSWADTNSNTGSTGEIVVDADRVLLKGQILGNGHIAARGSKNRTLALDVNTDWTLDAIVGNNEYSANKTEIVGTSSISLEKLGSGTLTLNGANTYSGKTTVLGGKLNYTKDFVFHDISLASGTQIASSASMSILGGSTLTLDMSMALGASTEGMLKTTGAFAKSGSGLINLTLNGIDNTWTTGDYVLINAGSGLSLDLFNWTNSMTNLGDYETSLIVSGNQLIFRIADGATYLYWTGDTNVWSGDSTDSWKNTGGDKFTTANGSNIKLTDDGLAQSSITISGTVTPLSISVENTTGEYVFNADPDVADSFITSTSLTKSGAGALTINNAGNTIDLTTVKEGILNLGVANALASGELVINSGVVNLNADGAFGGTSIVLNGGSLKMASDGDSLSATNILKFKGGLVEYAGNSTQDISNFIDAGSTSAVHVKLGANDVAWNPSNMSVLGKLGLIKDGVGKLSITSSMDSASTFQGGITLSGGQMSLNLNEASVWTGAVALNEGTNLQLSGTYTFNGALSGKGGIDVHNALSLQSSAGYTGNITLSDGASLSAKGALGGQLVFGSASSSAFLQSIAAGETLTYAGKLEGGADNKLSAQHGTTNVLTGNLSNFAGTLTKENAAHLVIWKLQNARLNAGMQLAGASFDISNTAATTLLNLVSNVDDKIGHLTQSGTGLLTLMADNTATGTLTIGTGGVQMGNGGGSGSWAGNLAGAGALTINRNNEITVGGNSVSYSGLVTVKGGATVKMNTANALGSGKITLEYGDLNMNGAAVANQMTMNRGNLLNAQAYTGKLNIAASVGANAMNLGGIKGSQINGISMVTNTTLTNIDGNITLGKGQLKTFIDTANTNLAADGGISLIQFNGTGGQLNITDMSIDLSAAVLDGMKTNNHISLSITNGVLNGVNMGDNFKALNITFNPILEAIGFAVKEVDGGSLVITGDAELVYTVLKGAPKVITYNRELDPYKAINVNDVLTINGVGTSKLEDGIKLSGLYDDGKGTGHIVINKTDNSAEKVKVDLIADLADGTYTGKITGNDADLYKTGSFTQTLLGDIQLNGIHLAEGDLNLGGKTTVNVLDIDAKSQDDVLTLMANSLTTVKDLTGKTGSLNVEKGGVLQIVGKSSGLSNTSIQGEGGIVIEDKADILLTGSSTINDALVQLKGTGTLKLANGTNNSLSGLISDSATSVLDFGNEASLIIKGNESHVYHGSLAGSGTMEIQGSATQYLTGSGSKTVDLSVASGYVNIANGSVYKTRNLTLNNGNLSISGVMGNDGVGANTTLQVDGNVSMTNGSSLDLFVYTSSSDWANQPIMNVSGSVTLSDSTISLSSYSASLEGISLTELNIVLMDAGSIDEIKNMTVDGGSLFSTFFHSFEVKAVGNQVVLTAVGQAENPLGDAELSNNSSTGSTLLWEGRRLCTFEEDSHLTKLLSYVGDKSYAATDRSDALASAAGSAVTTLSAAQMGNMKTHTQWIRNRVIQTGLDLDVINADLPYFNMWIEGTGAYQKLNASGHDAGYSLSSWGGTVGADMNLSEKWTAGMAFGVNFGKLDAKSVDVASGHLDSYYLSLYSLYKTGNWSNAFIVTGGLNDGKLDRTVAFGDHSYRTRGKTNGGGFSAMYELTYDYAINEDKTSILQPLFNAAVYSTNMKGYTEEGAGDASLHVDDQKYTVVSLALGGRWIKEFKSGLFGRSAFFDFRANVSQDFGDERAQANVGFMHTTDINGRITGAEIGSTALQLGAGLVVPSGEQSSFFINANADFRSKASGVDGQIGYRYNF